MLLATDEKFYGALKFLFLTTVNFLGEMTRKDTNFARFQNANDFFAKILNLVLFRISELLES